MNLPWFSDEQGIDFILTAIEEVAEKGWKMLPQYHFDWKTAGWKHHSKSFKRMDSNLKHLDDVTYSDDGQFEKKQLPLIDVKKMSYRKVLNEGHELFHHAKKEAKRLDIADELLDLNLHGYEHLRWFLLPSEAQDILCR